MAVAELVVKVGADISALTRGLDQANSKVKGFSRGMKSAGGAISGVGKKMTMGLTLPILGFGALMVKTASDFEQQINIMGVAAKGGGESMDDLRAAAIAVGADAKLVGISAAEAAGAITEMYKAGLTTTQIFGDMQGYLKGTAELSGALKASVDLAAASELDLASATDAVTVAMATFGIEESQASKVADSFVRAADASVASVGGLTDAMKNVGPTAAAYGWSLGEVNTALAILSTRGIEGSEAGTALKSMMTHLTSGTKKVNKALKELNVSLFDSEGRMKALPTIMAELEDAMVGMTEEQKINYRQTLAGSYGQKAMNTLLDEGKAGWEGMTEAMAGAASVQESAEARTEGLAGAMEQLEAAFETFMLVAGGPLIENVITPLVKGLTKVIAAFANAPPGVIKLALAIAGIVAVAGPLLMAIGGIITAVGTIGGAISGVVGIVTGAGGALVGVFAAIATASAPVLLVIAAIALAIGALYLAWKNNWLGIRDTMEMVGKALKATWERIKMMFGSIGDFLKGEITFDELKTEITRQLGAIAAIWDRVWTKLTAKVREVVSVITGVFDKVKGAISGFIEGWQRAGEMGMGVWDRFVMGLWEAYASLKTGFGIFEDTFFQFFDKIKAGFDNFVSSIAGIGEKIAAAVQGLKDKVLGFMESLKSGFLGKLADMVGKAAGIVAGLVGKIFGALTGGRGEGGGGFVLNLVSIGELVQAIKTAAVTIKADVQEMTAFTSATITAWLQLVKGNIINTWIGILSGTSEFLIMLQQSIVTGLTTLHQFIVGWLDTFKIAFMTANQQILMDTMLVWRTMVAFVIQQANYMRTTVVMIVTAMAEQIKAILQDLADAGRKAGEALAQGVADGIKARQGAAVAAAMAMAAAVRAALPSSDAKKGPLSDLTNAGRALPKAFAKGIKSNAGVVAKAANALASNVCPAVRQAAVCAGNAGAGLGGGGNGNAPAPPLTNAAAKAKDPTTNSQNININVNNPNGETTNASVTRQLRNLAYLGMLSNEAGANA